MKNIITILMIAVISFFTANVSANNAVPLPTNLTDVTDGTEFWCQGTDTIDGGCEYLAHPKTCNTVWYTPWGYSVLGWFIRRN
ncbi:hypothetical protein O5823_13655 [Escherichia coli]|nr:hypothetical protein [Escherichia coli]MCZ5622430.1 hypothetical protein [Escherichia coli]